MYKRFGLTIVLIACFASLFSQERLNTFHVDQESLKLYQEQKWKDLIALSKEAQDQGIDFYYLQARTGIAYYNLKKYRKASEYLLKAWEMDKSFDWLQRYLYYSLILGGMPGEAYTLAADFSPGFKEEIGYAEKKITHLALEGGYCFNPGFDELSAQDFSAETELVGDYGEAFLFRNYHFESIDLSHQVKPGISINHNFTYIGVNSEQLIDLETSSYFPNYYSQFQYFINPHLVLGEKLHISPSLNIIWGKLSYEGLSSGYDSHYSTTGYYSDLVFTTSVWGHWGNFAPGAEVAFANIYDEGFSQYSAWLTYYPFSNTNFYLTPRVYFKADNENSLSFNTVGISGGVQAGKLHFTGQYLHGNMKNFIEPVGYVVSNFPGKSNYKFTGSVYVPIGKKNQLVFRYINQNIIDSYKVNLGSTTLESIDYSYVKHTLTFGLSWRF